MKMVKLGALSLAAASAVPFQTFASEGSDPMLEEVVVTAQRREQNVNDVGIAISVLGGDELRSRGLSSSADLAATLPGIHMSGSLAGQSQQFSIRGVTQNDFNDTIEAPVAVYIDEAYVPAQQGQTLAMFDIARVEALKGPQGTLFGRNATGGLVHFIVNQPSGVLEGHADLSYGRFDETRVEAAVGGPLGSNISGRASVFYSRIDNFWENVYPEGALPAFFGAAPGLTSFDAATGRSVSPCCSDEGGQRTYAGRLQLLYEPIDDLNIRFVGAFAQQRLSTAPYTTSVTSAVVDSQGRVVDTILTGPTDTRTIIGPDGQNYFNPTLFPLQGAQAGLGYGPAPGLRYPGATWFGYRPPDPKDLKLSVQYARPDANSVKSASGAIHVNYDFGSAHLVSITNYMQFDKQLMMDATGTPQNLFQYGSKARTSSVSQEIRLNGELDSLKWVTGMYYLHINADGRDGLLGSTGSLFASSFGFAATGIDPIAARVLKTDSASLFGQVEYEFIPQWTLVVGARAIREQQDYNLRTFGAANTNDYAVDANTILIPDLFAPFQDKRTQELYAGKVQLEYRPSDGLLLYLGANRGVKAGSYNAKSFDGSPPLDPALIPYKPEVLTSVEGGFKLSSDSRRYTLGGAVYHYDYKDYQAFLFTTTAGYVQNVKARTNGLEIDTTVQLTSNFRAMLGYAYIDAVIPDYEVAPGVPRDVRPTFTSKNHANLDLVYTLPGSVFDGEAELRGNVNYTSSFFHNLKNFSSEELPARTVADVTAAWTSGAGQWRVSAYIKNLTDRRYATVGFDSATNCGCSITSYGMPRTYGVGFGANF